MVSEKTIDVVRRAKQLYKETLQTKLEATNKDDFVAIEPDTGDYFFGKTLSEAVQAARKTHPDRLTFVMRVGHKAAVHIGVMTS